jgi:hypothetical protein
LKVKGQDVGLFMALLKLPARLTDHQTPDQAPDDKSTQQVTPWPTAMEIPQQL